MSGKWVELLKQTAPGVARAVVLRDPAQPTGIAQLAAMHSVAPSVGVELISGRYVATLKRSNAASPHSCVGAMAA